MFLECCLEYVVMLRGWCWYVLGYGMDLVQKVMDVEFMGVSEGGEVGVGALCVKV